MQPQIHPSMIVGSVQPVKLRSDMTSDDVAGTPQAMDRGRPRTKIVADTPAAQRVQYLLNARDLKVTTASKDAGLGRTYITDLLSGTPQELTYEKAHALAPVLGTSPEWLLEKTPFDWQNPPEPVQDALLETPTWERTPVAAPGQLMRDLPLLGEARGGLNGQFPFNLGEPIAFVDRPPSLAGNARAFAVLMRGRSMRPRYYDGEILYCNPLKNVELNDYAVVEIMRPGHQHGDPPEAFVKQVKSLGSEFFELKQFDPPADLRMRTQDLVRMTKIVGTADER